MKEATRTSARVSVVALSSKFNDNELMNDGSPPARPMARLSQNHIAPPGDSKIKPGSREEPYGTSACNDVSMARVSVS